MKKKGFTLIELLAVIVILAIIALIATPLVLKYIETARTNSKIVSTQNYIKAVENSLASYSITNKGKSYPNGCYDIIILNKTLEISVKSDIPSEGKICIEKNKIEKAIVKYLDNKIIKYQNEKLAESDEEEYNSFNDSEEVLFEVNAEFQYNGDDNEPYADVVISMDNLSFERIENGYEYNLYIDDVFATKVFAMKGDGFVTLSSNDPNKMIYMVTEGNELVLSAEFKFSGLHNIKVSSKQVPESNVFLFVGYGGDISLVGSAFVAGQAHVLIKDEDGSKYFDDEINLMVNNFAGIYGADYGCRNNLPMLPELYEALINGKKITTIVTQIVDEKEIITTINGDVNYHDYYRIYYWGQLGFVLDVGC